MYTKKPLRTLICGSCGKEYKNTYSKSKYCSNICRHNYWNDYAAREQTVASSSISKSTVGAISELMVCSDLMTKGYSVFRAISMNCFSDLIAIKGDKIYQVEVKTGRYRRDNKVVWPRGNTEGKCLAVYTFRDNKIHYITHPELS